jgi:uncharacterized protein YegJ (DUF2314 family)
MKLFLLFISAISLVACNNDGKKVGVRANEKDSTDHVAVYKGDNDEMNAAIAKARATYPEFLEALKKPCNECDRFNVKIRLGFGEIDGEHVWLDSLFFKKDNLYGILASVPEKVTRVDIGDIMEAKPDSLSDWMYIKNGKLVGGYTIKVIYDTMGDAEKKQLEEEFGATIR